MNKQESMRWRILVTMIFEHKQDPAAGQASKGKYINLRLTFFLAHKYV